MKDVLIKKNEKTTTKHENIPSTQRVNQWVGKMITNVLLEALHICIKKLPQTVYANNVRSIQNPL